MSSPTVVDRDRQQAIQYLRSHRNGSWYWTEGGQVLAWRDGTTLAFRQEIARTDRDPLRHSSRWSHPYDEVHDLMAGGDSEHLPRPVKAPLELKPLTWPLARPHRGK